MSMQGRRVLIVEDDEIFRRMLVGVFAFAEFEISEAATGREAVRVAEGFEPEIVVIDIIMNDIDGLEVISLLKKSLPEAKFIAMCGGGRIPARDYLFFAKKMGAHAVLEKPFEHEELMSEVRKLLEIVH